jgi:uncharacterized protein (TIGR02246 family)
MKKLMLLASLIASMCLTANLMAADPAQNPSAKGEDIVATINALMDQVSRTAETLDAQKTVAILTDAPDAVFFFCSKPYSKAALAKALAEIYGTLTSMKINMTKTQVTVLGPDAAVWTATGTTSSVGKSGETFEESLTETWIWKKIDGQWRVIHYHESVARPGPASAPRPQP